MSEEQLVKDGALFFNAPDKNKRKPNVIYYNTTADTTGIEYTKLTGVEKPGSDTTSTGTAWFKILMTLVGMTIALGITSVVYFLVVKLRKKDPVELKVLDPPETQQVTYEGVTENSTETSNEVALDANIALDETSAKDVGFFNGYFKSLLPGSVK